MSLAQTTDITCPKCAAAQSMQLWSSVNVTLDPHLREEVMQQRLNVFCCAQCGYSGSVDASLLYHDMDGGYCIQYVAKDDMKNPGFYQNLTKEGTAILDPISAMAIGAAGGGHLFHPHYVFSMSEVVLYVAFRDLCAAFGRDP